MSIGCCWVIEQEELVVDSLRLETAGLHAPIDPPVQAGARRGSYSRGRDKEETKVYYPLYVSHFRRSEKFIRVRTNLQKQIC